MNLTICLQTTSTFSFLDGLLLRFEDKALPIDEGLNHTLSLVIICEVGRVYKCVLRVPHSLDPHKHILPFLDNLNMTLAVSGSTPSHRALLEATLIDAIASER